MARTYEEDVWFAAVCMGIFAVASRWCDDERVRRMDASVPGCDKSEREEHRSGWVYLGACIGEPGPRAVLLFPVHF
jgi:hypothetical protein